VHPYVPNSDLGALAALGWTPPLESATEHLRSALRDAIAASMGDIYHCGRVWSAWSHGTMRENDFSLAAEDDDILANITDAVLAVYASNTGLPGLRQVGGVQTDEINPCFTTRGRGTWPMPRRSQRPSMFRLRLSR